MEPILVFSPGKFHEQRGLAGSSPRGHKVSNTTEQSTTQAPWHREVIKYQEELCQKQTNESLQFERASTVKFGINVTAKK